MSNVTFSSPVMARDLTVYAVAGDRGTILAVAKAHKVPIPFDCQDGECGSCLVEVKHLAPNGQRYGISLTEKEKELLKQLGKITPEEIHDAEVNDMPPRYRLACQCFIRDEDILVSFEGDQTLPAKRPHVTPAAKIFKGGSLEIASLDDFLGYAVKAEEDAAIHYEEMAASMEKCGNQPVAKLFAQLARFSRMHLAEAQSRAGSIDVSKHLPADYAWPDQATPERADIRAALPAGCVAGRAARGAAGVRLLLHGRRHVEGSRHQSDGEGVRRRGGRARADSRSVDHTGGMGAEEPAVTR